MWTLRCCCCCTHWPNFFPHILHDHKHTHMYIWIVPRVHTRVNSIEQRASSRKYICMWWNGRRWCTHCTLHTRYMRCKKYIFVVSVWFCLHSSSSSSCKMSQHHALHNSNNEITGLMLSMLYHVVRCGGGHQAMYEMMASLMYIKCEFRITNGGEASKKNIEVKCELFLYTECNSTCTMMMACARVP